VKYRRIVAVLIKHGDQELDYAQKFLCTLYSMTNGLVEEQRDMLDVLEYASIRSALPVEQERELADHLVHFLEIECNPARIETVRDMDEIRLTSAGLEWCDARCVKHVWRHNSEISLKGW
jgi:hypothetical protein